MSVLLSWQPARLASAGQDLLRRAGDLQRSAGELTGIRAGLAGTWSGAAAQAATAHHRRRSAEVDELAAVVHRAGQALIAAAEGVTAARGSLRSALSAAAARCTVLDDGTVLPPARPPVPAGVTGDDLTAWQRAADAAAEAHAAGAARLATQIRAALHHAGAADDTSAAALSALQTPAISAAPRPVSLGLTGGQWGPLALPSCPVTSPAAQTSSDEDDGHWWDGVLGGVADVARATAGQVAAVPGGIRDGVVEPSKMIGGLVGLNGDVSDNWSALQDGLAHSADHPAEFGKALIGWDDLSAGRYGHWAGELVPGAAAALATGGAGAAVRGTKATEKVTEVAAKAEEPAVGLQLPVATTAIGAAAVQRRVVLRAATKATIRQDAIKTADGDFIDPNTGTVVPKDGPLDYGHKPGFEWRRTQERARAEGWTRERVIEYENDPSHYQIEDPSANRSHKYEQPGAAAR